MDESTQHQPGPDLTELQARHESGSQEIDPYDVALLFNRVGSELTKVDKASVSPSTKSAMQLTEQQVFQGMPKSQPTAPAPSQQPVPPPMPKAEKSPPPARATPPPPPKPIPLVDNDLLKRVESLEKTFKKIESFSRAYSKAKKIKRGVKYSVSSNSMKGEIKESDVLLEYVLCEISKGVKTITIKICED